MYRARRMIQPKIPLTAKERIDMLSTTQYMKYFKFAARCEDQIVAVFYSKHYVLEKNTKVQFDRTFFKVFKQFFSIMDYICFGWVSQFTSNSLLNLL